MVLKLPEGVTPRDFEDWINEKPHRKNLEFRELPEKWTSLETGYEEYEREYED